MPKLLKLKKIYTEQVFALILDSYRDESNEPGFVSSGIMKIMLH